MSIPKVAMHAGQSISNYFNDSEVEAIAHACRFVQRRSPLTGLVFLQTLVFGFLRHPRASLIQLSQVCFDLDVSISPQGLDQRINSAAVMFLKEMLALALERCRARQRPIAAALDQFSAVYFQDSSTLALPVALRDLFPGFGGNASAAAVKIQLLFDYLRGNITHLELLPARASDQGYQGHLSHIQPGSLLLQDLGFFSLDNLHTIVKACHAFFLTRWQNQTTIFLAQRPHQALEMLAFLRRQVTSVMAYDILLGARHRIPCRMVCVRLPERVVAERRRRVKADAKRRSKPVSKRTLELLAWNVFVTNVPPQRLSLRQILVCYSLRWQVELIFKLWKSEAALKHLRGVRPERILCEFYAKMIGIVLTHFLTAPLRFMLRDQHVEISLTKARQVLQDRVAHIAAALRGRLHGLQLEIQELCRRILRFARKTKRKTDLSTFEKFLAADRLEICQLYPLA